MIGDALTLDGSHGEGGGQILRTALSLAVVLCRPVTVTRIRAGRPRRGLQPQHLAVVRALATVSAADVTGAELGSTELCFVPHTLRGGEFRFDVGAVKPSAGSVSLLFQALLLPLALAPTPSRLTLIGGTHVPASPPAHYLTDVFLDAVRQIGIQATLAVRRWGWYPAGGGEVEGMIVPVGRLGELVREAPTALDRITGLSAVSCLPRSIAERQCQRTWQRLSVRGLSADISIEEDVTARSPGTLLFLALRGRAGFSALGRRGVSAERVADEAVAPLLAFAASGAAIDNHLADQLVPFLALAREVSRLTCPSISSHLRTVAWVIQQLLPVRIELHPGPPARVLITPGTSR